MKIINGEDIKKIFEKYSIGSVKSSKKINRRFEGLQPSFIIKTSKGKYFLKQYWNFDYSKRQGLDFNIFLQKKKYPCVKVLLTKMGKPYFKFGTIYGSVYEHLDYDEKKKLSSKELYEYGKGLAKLHLFTKGFRSLKETYSPKYYNKEFEKNFYLAKSAPKKFREILKRIRQEYPLAIKKIQKLPKGICHTEYTPQHSRFYKGMLVSVIDWDLINKSLFMYDLGTSVSIAVKKKSILFNSIKEILRGYESIRKLSGEERGLLYESIFLGIVKFVTWGLDKDEIRVSGWGKIGLEETDYLMKVGKERFDEKIGGVE